MQLVLAVHSSAARRQCTSSFARSPRKEKQGSGRMGSGVFVVKRLHRESTPAEIRSCPAAGTAVERRDNARPPRRWASRHAGQGAAESQREPPCHSRAQLRGRLECARWLGLRSAQRRAAKEKRNRQGAPTCCCRRSVVKGGTALAATCASHSTVSLHAEHDGGGTTDACDSVAQLYADRIPTSG